MTHTTNLHLKKPDLTDIANIADLNDNADTLDIEVKAVKDRVTVLESTATSQGNTLTSLGTTVSGHTAQIAALNNKTANVSNKNATLSWGSQSTLATVDGTNITANLPANPNTWRGFQIKTQTTRISVDAGPCFARVSVRVYPSTGYVLAAIAGIRNSTDTVGTRKLIVYGVSIMTPLADSTNGSLIYFDVYNTSSSSAAEDFDIDYLCFQPNS